MSCHHIESKLYLYIEGKLNFDEHKEIEAHLAICNICHKNYLEWKQVNKLLENANLQEPPPNFTLNVMSAINKVGPLKMKEKFWLIHLYKNLGRGLIATGILAVFLNSWVLVGDLPVLISIDKAFSKVEQISNKYFEIYDQVAINLGNLNTKGGNLFK